MNTQWSLDSLDENCDYIIFDDIAFDTFRNWKAFLGKPHDIYPF
jgi:hypothetical protein